MTNHPLFESISVRIISSLIFIAAWAVLGLLIVVYGRVGYGEAFWGSLFFVATLGGLGYFYWFIKNFLAKTPLVQLAVWFIVQLIVLAVVCIFYFMARFQALYIFKYLVLLYFIYGSALWIILIQYYNSIKSVPGNTNDNEIPTPSDGNKQITDRISVKNGTEVTIIKVSELTHIQAYGDYVFLHTDVNKYMKEQTMKYLESTLPETFVRIHRSFIINTEKIARIELFGKETYNVHLKNGTCIRASSAGYKLLKVKLNI